MRLFLRSLLVLMLVLIAVPMVQASSPVNAPAAPMDDEIILLTSDGRISVRDPHTSPGIRPVAWESPGNGFTNVITGDFNGDTAAEVVGLRGNQAIVFSPVVLPGSMDIGRTFTASAGQAWTQFVTGDLDGDGRDELVLVQTTNEPNQAIRIFIYQWEPGSGWGQITSAPYGADWQAIATGDVDGDGKDEFVGVRNPPNDLSQINIFKLTNTVWQSIFTQKNRYPWITVAVGDVIADGSNRAEIVATRNGVGSDLASMLVFRYPGSSTDLQTLESSVFNPPFERLALGDVNNSGVDTIYLLRPGITNGDIRPALANKYYGPGQVATFNELANQDRFRAIHTGDLYGDGRAELVTMASTEYLIYTNPADNVNFQQIFGNFSTRTNFAIANLDGPGIPVGPALSVSPTSITWSIQAGQPISQQLQITNSGGSGTLNWTAAVTEGGSWLSVSPTAGTAPSTVLVSANTTNLVGGTYTGNVRITAGGGAFNSPVDVPVSLTVTAPQFSVGPSSVSWYYRPGTTPPQRLVQVVGPSINWHAGVVPTSMVPQIEAAIASGTPLRIDNGFLLIGDQRGPDDVPLVRWIDINPTVGTATQSGTTVQLNLVTSEVDYGFSSAAIVFVADQVASPPAVVVRASVLRSLADQSDLTFMPLIQ